MNAEKLSVGSTSETFLALVRRHGTLIVLTVVGLAAFDTVLELAIGPSIQSVGNVVSIAAAYLLYRKILVDEGMIEVEGRFGRYFGASLLSGLGMVVGFIFLIVPGLYLAARWSVAGPLAITRDLKAGAALRASWELTRHSVGTLMLIYLVLVLAFLSAIFAVAFGTALAFGTEDGLAATVLPGLVADAGFVLGCVLTVAITIELTGSQSETEAIFA